MKRTLFGIIALFGAAGGCGVPDLPTGQAPSAMKCAPLDVDCVGDPGGVPCGHNHEICCGINGYTTDCRSAGQTCNPTSYTCVNNMINCTVTCANPGAVYLNFSVAGNATSGQVYTAALWRCLGSFATYYNHTCTY